MSLPSHPRNVLPVMSCTQIKYAQIYYPMDTWRRTMAFISCLLASDHWIFRLNWCATKPCWAQPMDDTGCSGKEWEQPIAPVCAHQLFSEHINYRNMFMTDWFTAGGVLFNCPPHPTNSHCKLGSGAQCFRCRVNSIWNDKLREVLLS